MFGTDCPGSGNVTLSAVRVIHVMFVPAQFRYGSFRHDENFEDLLLLIKSVCPPHLYYEGYERTTEGIVECDIVVQATEDWCPRFPLSGEYVWVREIESDEVFDSTASILLLRPTDVIPLSFDFAQQVFAGSHGAIFEDVNLHLFDNAFDRLLSALGSDYEACFGIPWPDELPDLITEALRHRDLLRSTNDDIMGLAGEIIQALPAPHPRCSRNRQ